MGKLLALNDIHSKINGHQNRRPVDALIRGSRCSRDWPRLRANPFVAVSLAYQPELAFEVKTLSNKPLSAFRAQLRVPDAHLPLRA